MKRLTNPQFPKNQLEETFSDWLNPTFVAPLGKLGLRLKSFGHLWEKSDSEGVWVLKFEEWGESKIHIMDETRQEDYQAMVEICTQQTDPDDAFSPNCTHRLTNGTLWLFIPYID